MNRFTLKQRLRFMGNLFPKPKTNWSEMHENVIQKFGHKEGPTVPDIHTYIHNWPLQPFSQDY